MAVFMEGRIVQVGTPEAVYARPASVEVAAFLGNPPMNLLPARLEEGALVVGAARFPAAAVRDGTREATLGLRPAALRLGASGIPARVYLVEHLGDDRIVNLEAAGRVLKMRTDARTRVAEGEQVHVAFDPADAHLFDAATGQRI
jgi:ABC-type sugar transport system ATPase subunit